MFEFGFRHRAVSSPSRDGHASRRSRTPTPAPRVRAADVNREREQEQQRVAHEAEFRNVQQRARSIAADQHRRRHHCTSSWRVMFCNDPERYNERGYGSYLREARPFNPFDSVSGPKTYREFCAMRRDFDESLAGLSGRERYERARAAIHECGHLLALWHLEEAAEFFEITVVPDGETLGCVTSEGPELCSRRKLFTNVMENVAGKIAEEIFFGDSDGTETDMEEALAYARQVARRVFWEGTLQADQVERPQAPPHSPPVGLHRQSLRGQRRCRRQTED
uniref:Peptidase_M41 domain-containing protein n=1 Tax=Globodera pallida TaxID=36090 RepID=A0A183BXE8_GLOPA